jgi:hypothetical protein
MFLLRCQNNQPGLAAVNAIPPDHVSANHIAMLQRLAELGMQLAERAAAEALQAPPAEPAKHRRPDPSLLFIRLSGMVRACITQQVRLAAGKLPAAARERPATGQTVNELCQAFGISYAT